MMYQIDFLPEEYRSRRAARRWQFRRLLVLATVAALLMGGSFLLHLRQVQLEEQLEQLQPREISLAAQNKQLNTLRMHLRTARSMADLVGYLRHPWPRTQILTRVLAPLPESLFLDRIAIDRQPPEPQLHQHPGSRKDQESEKVRLATMPPASRDLERLRQECDQMQTIVHLKGFATEPTSLHQYLATLEKEDLFSKVELINLEKSDSGSLLRFQVRLIVRPGYGQAGGPRSAKTSAALRGPPALPRPEGDRTPRRG